ncbi:DUF1289 domain-containing protein [Bosea sp. (in: a-proteobacteria)]|uniref:DUF1289 domain-containing protein n=1 Tax=Bosea sp. (in: a-proteobacteria) TaxID=1871050 RepID=UPI003525F0E5
MTAISSPCVKLCQLDPTTRHCLGCGRSLDEIGRWSSLSEAERRAIMARLAEQTSRKA